MVQTPTNDCVPSRRRFLGQALGAGSSLLLGPLFTAEAALVGAPAFDPHDFDPHDAIWGPSGAATAIIRSLKHVSQVFFRKADFDVTTYGAQPCAVVAFTTPYTDPVRSPTSAGSDKTHAPGSFDSRPAFLAAIRACNAAGGGRVVVPSGNWYCAGPIELLSNVNFHLSANCVIYFSNNPTDYAKDGPVDCGANGKLYYSRWQCNDCLNYGSPIYARGQSNIALTGEDHTSILNGQAMIPFAGSGNSSTCWWTWKGNSGSYGAVNSSVPTQASNNAKNVDLKTRVPGISDALYALLTNPITPWQQDQNYLPCLSEAGVPIEQRIFGLGHYLRPLMVQFLNCTNVLMENYQTQQTPFWQHHPVNCKNVVIRGVKVDSNGPNNDGFDPDACDTVLCEQVEFNTCDDCVAIKSGKNLDTQYGPSQNQVYQDCVMNSGHGGITLGSEMGAGVRAIYARRLQMLNQFWATNSLNIAIRIKTNLNRGGFVEDLYVDDVTLIHGVSLTGAGYGSSTLPGSPINTTAVPVGVATKASSNPSASQGGIITFDCDYQPAKDAIRTRPPRVQGIHISNVRASNVTLGTITGSCFQAIVAQGPVAFDYNGPVPAPEVFPISNVTITDCDFGTPTAAGPASSTKPGPIYAYNVHDIVLKNVTIAGQVFNTTIVDAR